MNGKPKYIQLPAKVEKSTYGLLRIAGYVLLALAFMDYAAILIPPKFTDPNWEFQVIGQFVDLIWAPLVALAFILFYLQGSANQREIRLANFASWIGLCLGILYLLMVPLGINDSIVIYGNTMQRINDAASGQVSQIDKVSQRVKAASTLEELNNLNRVIQVPNTDPNNTNPDALKKQMLEKIAAASKGASFAKDQVSHNVKISLIKTAVKVNIGALLGGVALILFWYNTRWTRRNIQE